MSWSSSTTSKRGRLLADVPAIVSADIAREVIEGASIMHRGLASVQIHALPARADAGLDDRDPSSRTRRKKGRNSVFLLIWIRAVFAAARQTSKRTIG
jgi:hypothetical protein